MTFGKDIGRLTELADLIRDQRLNLLREAAERRDQSLRQIAALERPAAAPELSLLTEQLVGLRYQAWADHRRSELNTVLARQSADWLAARDEARQAFGRAEALRALAARQGRKT